MKYYNIVKNWRKIKRFLNDKKLNDILVRDFNKFTWGRWHQKFELGKFPRDYESCSWEFGIIGRHPEYFKYVKHSACHWLVNFNLRLVQLVEPSKNWRIITSQEHSTVFDGNDTLFDFNFMALGISPEEAFKIANKENIQLEINRFMKVYMAKPFWEENLSIKPKDWNKREK